MSVASRLPLPMISLFLWIAACSAPIEPITRELPEDVRLSSGLCPIIHCNIAQTDALPVTGPTLPSRVLSEEEIDHLWSSPIAGGILDYTYPDGQTVYWVPQVDRIMKLRLNEENRFQKITELPLEPSDFPRRSPEDMRRIVAELDASSVGTDDYAELAARWKGYQLEGLRAYYAMINSEGILYVGNRDGIVAYGDRQTGEPDSEIVQLGQYGFRKLELQLGIKMPMVIMIGLNVTPDGHLVAVTIDGTIVAVTPDLARGYYYNLDGEQIWNSVAIDEKGGVYVAGTRKLHKLIWTGSGWSDSAEDGAWVEPYAVGELDASLRAERGAGTTPALMGAPGARDRFVVTADAADVNNLLLYWRDEIPRDWKQISGTTSRRVAGVLPVNFGDESLENSYSENSATVFEYAAVLANNQVKTFEPMFMDVQLQMKDPKRTPCGVQCFRWNPEARRMEVAWTRPDVSSPNSTPVVATLNRQLHVVGLEGGQWVLQTLDWDTGATRARYTLGASERYNPIMLALELLPNGDPVFPAFGGVIHLRIGGSQ